jgi:hypothetical protein
MKILNIIIIAITIFCCNLFAQSGSWRVVDSLRSKVDQTLTLKAIDCADTLNCVIAGNLGFIKPLASFSTNGGITWSIPLIDSITKGDINPEVPAMEIAYPDTSLCIMACDEGYYWLSRDKCKTWERFRLDSSSLNYIHFYNKSFGGMTSYNHFYRTTDGGYNWIKIYKDDFGIEVQYLPYGIENVYYYNLQTIYLLLYRKDINDYIIKSDDGGITWNFICSFPYRITRLVFLDKKNAIAVGKKETIQYSGINRDLIYKSTDGGNTWELKIDTLTKGWAGLEHVYFSDNKNGVALGHFWDLWRTSDGGNNWIQDTSYYKKSNNYAVDIALLGSTKKFLMINEMNGYVIKYSEDEIINVNEEKPEINSDFKIYPNILSSGESLRIELKENKQRKFKFEIYNSIGSIIDSYEFYSDSGTYTLEYTPPAVIASGQYYIRIIKNDLSIVSKAFIIR